MKLRDEQRLRTCPTSNTKREASALFPLLNHCCIVLVYNFNCNFSLSFLCLCFVKEDIFSIFRPIVHIGWSYSSYDGLGRSRGVPFDFIGGELKQRWSRRVQNDLEGPL